MKEITVSVQRQPAPEAETYNETFQVELKTGMSILNVLDEISTTCDSSLAYEASCRRGICSVCMVNVNGKIVKSCMELASGDLELKNGSKFPIKDLAFGSKKRK
ncbi:2Fe-2S iron-sulfur cluster-binding protein [Alkalihalobacillus oceani]|uniref:2Fe-2S iron-sulfur cluster-binding protein n=1 Tax=Halalkalibacter oceani TaxID=1653776 RepID=A0A9X2IPD1_9BACI|nr:2Fe-2S iron-sulfur cluster-binding protein [Halalkalibacter oceani]